MLPVDVDRLSALGILIGRDKELATRRAGYEQLESSQIEVEEGKLADGLGVKQSGDIRSIELQRAATGSGRFSDYTRIANLQCRVDQGT